MRTVEQSTTVTADAARCMLLKQINMSNFYNKKSVEGAPIDMEDNSRVITVYYSAFGNVDSDGDIITPGAFTKTLKENGPQAKNRVWHLMNHSTDKPIAKPFEMREHSIGFQTIKSQAKSGYNEINEIKLFEGSSVLWGANANTPTVGVKSQIKSTLVDEMGKTIKSLRNGHFTDETFELLELKLKQLQQYLSEMEDEESISPEPTAEEALPTEEEDPMISVEIEINKYLQSFKIF